MATFAACLARTATAPHLRRCWSDGEAEDQRHHEDERRHPDEKGALSCFGSERVQLVSFSFHFSFTFHASPHASPIPRREMLASRSKGQTSPLRPDRGCGNLRAEQEAWRHWLRASSTDRMVEVNRELPSLDVPEDKDAVEVDAGVGDARGGVIEMEEATMNEDELIELLRERQNNGRTAYLTFGDLVAMVPVDQVDEWRAVLAKVRAADAARDAEEDAG
ncbi:MAG: hypothetical protein ACRDG8_02370 [Actinomycetota bacterium]